MQILADSITYLFEIIKSGTTLAVSWLSSVTVRYTVKLLLQHDFFLEDTGIKVEMASKDEAKDLSRDVIQLWLRVIDPKRRKHRHKEDEAIQFDYNIKKDDADKVAQEMVGTLR